MSLDVGSLAELSQEIVQFRLRSRFPTLSIKQPICVLIIKQTAKVFPLQTRLDICKTHLTSCILLPHVNWALQNDDETKSR